MFGPVSTMSCASVASMRSFGMNFSRAIMRSTTGWRRMLLPFVAIGLVVRAVLVAGRRTVHHAPPAALH